MSLTRKNSSESLTGFLQSTISLIIYLKEKTIIIEEKNSKGEIIKKYLKGRFLGKVIQIL